MKKLGLIPFNFGAAISERLSNDLVQFYKWLAGVVMQEDCELYLPSDGSHDITLALNLYEYEEEVSVTFQKIFERFQVWDSNVDVAVFDKTLSADSVVSGPVDVQIAAAIDALIYKAEKPTLYILLVPELPPEGEMIHRMLEKRIAEGKVVFIDNDGNYLAEKSLSIDLGQYKIKKADVSNNSLDLLQIKMIRRLGHFKKENQIGKHCVRYFYDGTHCEKELVTLILEYIDKEYQTQVPLILYYKQFSDWLKNPAIAVAQKIGAECININDFLGNTAKIQCNYSVAPLILFPLIDTGNTCELILNEWKKKGFPKPNVLTVLTTRGVGHNSLFQANGAYDEHKIRYFLQIERQTYIDKCPMCQLEIPGSKFDHEDYAMLTTYDIWEMADKAGWAEEKDVPAYRTGLGLIPDFEKMILQNGAWLARKITERLISHSKNYPAQPLLLVCPDEKGANALADYLGVIKGMSIIHIPKGVINSSKSDDDIAGLLKKCEQDTWCMQLSSASKLQPVVIVEEFCASGKTRRILSKILRHKGLEVLCHFAVFNFDQTNDPTDIDSYVLYELNMNTWEEIAI
ncbi:MAG: hypothetical protein HZC48_01175 [Nitrospirae bacterium]|nr:hypothetical protein [Nitrospirota bacterium]